MGRATSRVRSLLCTSCASGEDRGDIDIDTEVLKEIAPLAQDRRARNSHHLAIVAAKNEHRPPQPQIPLLPPFSKNYVRHPPPYPQRTNVPHLRTNAHTHP